MTSQAHGSYNFMNIGVTGRTPDAITHFSNFHFWHIALRYKINASIVVYYNCYCSLLTTYVDA